MSNSALQFDEMELEYQVDYRERQTSSVSFERSSRSKYLHNVRHRRRSSPQSLNGIHRRGRKSLI